MHVWPVSVTFTSKNLTFFLYRLILATHHPLQLDEHLPESSSSTVRSQPSMPTTPRRRTASPALESSAVAACDEIDERIVTNGIPLQPTEENLHLHDRSDAHRGQMQVRPSKRLSHASEQAKVSPGCSQKASCAPLGHCVRSGVTMPPVISHSTSSPKRSPPCSTLSPANVCPRQRCRSHRLSNAARLAVTDGRFEHPGVSAGPYD